tara:strand:- start:780 stop:932 length:153 start_codon:yes stop_codon:yes gene_type:complete
VLALTSVFPWRAQVSWAVADGEDNKAQDQTASCAGFFAKYAASLTLELSV